MKLIVSVSRDVLESVEASQICFCNVDEDTIGWAQEAALSPGIHASVCLQIVGGFVVYIGIFGSSPFQLGRDPVPSKTQIVGRGAPMEEVGSQQW